MQNMCITVISQNADIVVNSSFMRKIDYIMREKRRKRQETLAGTNFKAL